MKKHIPNMFTCTNVFSGCIGTVMAFEGNYLWAAIWVMIGAICDFFDGFTARMLKAHSPIGKDLDSLADMVSFGIVPSVLAFRYLSDSSAIDSMPAPLSEYIPYIGFMIAVFSALRLANFNVDTRQTTSFIGLPTPANALFWISLCYGLSNTTQISDQLSSFIVIGLTVTFSFLLTAEIPMFSLKIKDLKLKGNGLRYILLAFVIIAIIQWHILGICASIIVYILLSIFSNVQEQRRSNKQS